MFYEQRSAIFKANEKAVRLWLESKLEDGRRHYLGQYIPRPVGEGNYVITFISNSDRVEFDCIGISVSRHSDELTAVQVRSKRGLPELSKYEEELFVQMRQKWPEALPVDGLPPIPPPPTNAEGWRKVLEYHYTYEPRKTNAEIAEQYGVTHSTVRQWASKLGLSKRKNKDIH